MTMQDDATALTGAVIAEKYRLDRLLGAGGMGAVYAGENTFLRAPVAIKVLHAWSARSPSASERFIREAQAAAQVRHPNIVGVLDVGVDAQRGTLYLVQELLSGTDLDSWLESRGPVAPAEALAILMPIMRALAHVHAKGIVHRDLKPGNIFLCATPEGFVPKLIDFGIAKVLDERGEQRQLTATSEAIGTPQFMSPEQAAGERTVDCRSDVWALGVVLYRMLSGHYPHEAEGTLALIAAILTREPTRIETYVPSLPAPVVALVHRALAREPAARFATMDDFWTASRACCDGLAMPVAQPAPVPETFMVAQTLPRPRRLKRAFALAGGGALAALLAVAAIDRLLEPPAATPPPGPAAPAPQRDASPRVATRPTLPPTIDAGRPPSAVPSVPVVRLGLPHPNEPPRAAVDAGTAPDAGRRRGRRSREQREPRSGESVLGGGLPSLGTSTMPPPNPTPPPNPIY